MQLVLTPELILEAYRQGLFPMAHHAESSFVQWVCPEDRGQLSITDLHIPKRLLKTIRRAPYTIKINTAFADVIALCAQSAPDRPETWINQSIQDVFTTLHRQGHAHSVEAWEGEKLVGGIYGLSIGGAFFGESMFSRATDASKICLVHLCARLWRAGYKILDTQFSNDHLTQFGVYEIAHADYMLRLGDAFKVDTNFAFDHISQDTLLREYLTFRGQI